MRKEQRFGEFFALVAKEESRMLRSVRIVAWALLTIAIVLILLSIISWPPGGLMFALPFVFFIPGIFLALIGAGVLCISYRNSDRNE